MALRFPFILVLLFLSIVPFALFQAPPEPQYRIGAILPLTGDAASWGEAIRNGVELALEELPPEKRRQVEVFYEDDQRNPRLSVLAFQKLLSVNHVSAVIGCTAQPGMAVAPLAEKAQIPFLSIAVPKRITEGKTFSYLFYSTTERMAHALVDEATRRNYRKIVRISSIHDGRLAMKQEFDRFNRDQIEVVLDEEYPIENKDFKPFLNKLKAQGDVDAIYGNLVLGQVGLLAKQARELNISLPIFESEMFEDESEVKLSQGALIGQWFVNERDPSAEFLKTYTERFPGAKIFNASNGYDAINVLLEAPTGDAKAIARSLAERKSYRGLNGEYRLLADRRFDIPVSIKVVKEKGFETIREVETNEDIFTKPARPSEGK